MATVPRQSPTGDNLSEAMAVYLEDNSQKISSPDKTVEIDESKFGKRKYHHGHRVQGQWIFGGVERGTGRSFFMPVRNRSNATLTAIIRAWVEPGTTIIGIDGRLTMISAAKVTRIKPWTTGSVSLTRQQARTRTPLRATGITSRSTSTLTAGRRGTSTNWPNTCSRRGARPTTSTPSPCSSTSSRALIGTFKRHNLHLPRLMLPSHEGTCACVTILLLITLHAKPTDYIRAYQRHRWQCTTSLVSQLKLFQKF